MLDYTTRITFRGLKKVNLVITVLYSVVANGAPVSHWRGSDSNSSGFSLSSSTPLSSLSGLSQVFFPPAFASEMVDVAVSTEDHPRCPSNAEPAAITAVPTDPQPFSNGSHHGSLVATETSRTVGATVLLKDTVIRGKGEGPREEGGERERGRASTRELSSEEQKAGKRSPQTAALMALSKPRRPIRRSQSQITASGEAGHCHAHLHTPVVTYHACCSYP